MEHSAWRELNDELNSDITILYKDEGPFVNTIKGEWPVVQYKKLCSDLNQDFISECRSKIEEFNQVPTSFNDLLLKLNYSFKNQFKINFPDGEIPFPLKYGNHPIPEVNTDNDPLITVVHSKIYAFGLAIRYLKTQLKIQPQIVLKKRIRKMANVKEFHSNLTPKQLADIFYKGKVLGFISDDTDQMNFIDIFLGRPAVKPINWTCTVYSLSKFIKGINGIGLNKITDGIWLVTSQLFLVNSIRVEKESLSGASEGKNDKLKQLKSLINFFNHPESLED